MRWILPPNFMNISADAAHYDLFRTYRRCLETLGIVHHQRQPAEPASPKHCNSLAVNASSCNCIQSTVSKPVALLTFVQMFVVHQAKRVMVSILI